MRGLHHHLDALTTLHRLDDREERRAAFRQSMATLAAAVSNQRRAVPLEGYNPETLLQSMRQALADGLLDDLSFLSEPAAAAALYELAAALPGSDAKRDLGRRVLGHLQTGKADTFVALATQLALGSRKALSGAASRARVALALDLPIGAGARADGLALALISRRELSREWLTLPATGSLPSRRLTARLLERAAREAAQRAAEGDDAGVRVFQTDVVQDAWHRLLGDRESLVWRHVASARGLLSLAEPRMWAEIHEQLSPELGITEWRRAAASLGASMAFQPRGALEACRKLLESPIFQKDRGLAAAMIYGLPRAAETEPGTVEELLEQLVRVGGLDAAEALVDLRRERIGGDLGAWAARMMHADLRDQLARIGHEDDGKVALMHAVADDLVQDKASRSMREMLSDALDAFVEQGPLAAVAAAHEVLATAEKRMEMLLRVMSDEERMERQHAFRALREIDVALLETDTLTNLLALGAQDPEEGAPLGDIFQRLSNWLVVHEGDPILEPGPVAHHTLRLRRLRTLLHLVDADGSHVDPRADLLRKRRLLAARVLFARARDDAETPLRRALCAATARAADALVREELAEVSDVLLMSGLHVKQPRDLAVMAEASMVPDIEAALRAYAKLVQALLGANATGRGVRQALDALLTLANELPPASSPRVEALRTALLDFARALESMASASSLGEIVEDSAHGTALASFEHAAQQLAQLAAGARRRIGEIDEDETPSSGAVVRLLDLCLERALRGNRDGMEDALLSVVETLEAELPHALAHVARATLRRMVRLPLDAPRQSFTSFLPKAPKEAPLPAWMPPNRTLGGFYVVRAIGNGAVGSVFVARRMQDRHDRTAEQFALKVPDYSGDAARTLSEGEFLQLFREEAGALLALPKHGHIANFVTFDAGARPKPILVMELVEGPTLERMIESGDMDMHRAFEVLDGLAQGLEAMHAVGVGHLDVKPNNVILRDPDGLLGPVQPSDAVLVDFGLAGRKIRPGCGTANYGGPEVWGLSMDHADDTRPEPADVYAFGCLAYEVLTRQTLFDGPTPIAMITAHVSHDGLPEAVGRMVGDPRTAGLAEVLRRCLRRSPRDRASIGEVRAALARVRPTLETLRWPLVA